MKRGFEGGYDAWYGQPEAKFMKMMNGMPMCLKALVSMREASCILGQGGAASKEIEQVTGTKLHVSGRNELYPGTSLQELSIRGPCAESVGTSLLHVFGKLAEESGRLSCGDEDVEEGGARVKLLVPICAAKAIIGRGGENIKGLRAATGLYVHIDEVAIGPSDAAEQMVSMQGSLQGVQAAVSNIVEKVAQFMSDPGFQSWAASSQAGAGDPIATQVAPGKASGKGKGGYGSEGKGGYGSEGKGVYGSGGPRTLTPIGGVAGGNWSDGWTRPEEAMPFGAVGSGISQQVAYAQEASWGESPAAMDMVSHAVQSLPLSCIGPKGKSQRVLFNIPSACVSAIIGKGGSGVKEISTGTRTKIMIREIVDEAGDKQTEEQVTLLGDTLGVVSAYLHIVGRIAAFEELAAGGGYPNAALEQGYAAT